MPWTHWAPLPTLLGVHHDHAFPIVSALDKGALSLESGDWGKAALGADETHAGFLRAGAADRCLCFCKLSCIGQSIRKQFAIY